jgi:hypothetical protein
MAPPITVERMIASPDSAVMAGLVPAIHVFLC